MEKEIRVCSRCVMDSTVPDIQFDDLGVCNFCNHYFDVLVQDLHSNDTTGEEKLNSLIKKIKEKGKNKQYDCLIGLSGGVDSSYVAYLIKKKYGLRALAIHLDNGWNTELSVSNVENIVKKLDIDLQTHVLDWKEFKDIQASFMKSSISNIEIPTDHAIWAVLIKTAGKLGIPYIIAGNNVVTESIMPESWLYGSKDSRLIKSIHSKFGKVKMKSYPRLTTFDFINYLLIKKIKWVPILNYVHFNKEEAKQILINELDWRDYGGKHYESVFTRFFHAYYLPTKFGFDLRKSYLSALICSGQIDQKTALEELAKPTAPAEMLSQDREYVIKKFGLTNEEFDNIMKAENKTFADYPNNDSLWRNFNWFVKIARNRIIRVD
jgi:N-acetyl sugar amidotransferase